MFELSVASALQSIESLLYSISSLLYLPVLLAIVGLVLYLLVCAGGVAGEWRMRRRGVRQLVLAAEAEMAAVAALTTAATVTTVTPLRAAQPGLDAQLERIVQQAETSGLRALDRVRFAVRIGPALGLMGTLIPMGIALAGLAQGNLPQMAQSMVTAFTATVVGLACSVLAYLLSLLREHWLRMDLADIAFAAETRLAQGDAHEGLRAVKAGA